MRRRLTALFVCFIVFCTCICCRMPSPVKAEFLHDYIAQYEEEREPLSDYCAVIFTLEDRPVSEYAQAKRMGAGPFVVSEEGHAVYEALIRAQDAVLAEICRLIQRTILPSYRYTATVSGFCIDITRREYQLLRDSFSLLACDRMLLASSDTARSAPREETPTPGNNHFRRDLSAAMSAYLGNDGTYGDGTGAVIAVIDTELDTNHEYFTLKEAGTGRLKREEIDDIAPYLSVTDHSTGSYYINEKIPYACNYETYTTETYCDSPDTVHGTHVSGIAAGNGGAISHNLFDVTGTAPNAQLVFLGNSHLREPGLLAAFDDCMYLGVDAVNCSFGAEGIPLNSDLSVFALEQQMLRSLNRAGIPVCVSAGNSGKYDYSGDALLSHPYYSPSGSAGHVPEVLTVASAENLLALEKTVQNSAGELVRFTPHGGFEATEYAGRELRYVAVPGIGAASDYEGLVLDGAFALVCRGEISFAEKSQNAADAGAAGIIFYDNTEEEPIAAGGSVLPGFSVTMEAGKRLASLPEKSLTVWVSGKIKMGNPAVSGYTSWNCTNLLTLKPDLLCFGGEIYSSLPDQSYGMMSGTSMAAPQASGIAAIVRRYLKEKGDAAMCEQMRQDPDFVAKLLMSSAVPVRDSETGTVISPRRQGSGVPNLKRAIETPVYLYTDGADDADRPKVSLGDDPGKKGAYHFLFFARNRSDDPVTYTLSYDLISDAVLDGTLAPYARELSGQVKFTDAEGMEIHEISVPAGGISEVHVSVRLSEADQEYMNRYFPNGTYAEGYIYLKNPKQAELTLPFMGFYGSWQDGPVFDGFLYGEEEICLQPSFLYTEGDLILGQNFFARLDGQDFIVSPSFSPNGDGVCDSIFLSVTLLRPVYDFTLRVYNEAGDCVSEECLGDQAMWHDGAKTTQCRFRLSWDGREPDGTLRDGASYRLACSCKVTPDAESFFEVSVKVKIDLEPPAASGIYRGILQDGTNFIYVNALNEEEIQGAAVLAPDGTLFSYDIGTVFHEGKRRIALPMPENFEGYTVELYDFAGNCTAFSVSEAVPCQKGDVNGDGTTDGRDAVLLLQSFAENEILLNADAADFNEDAKITGADLFLLMRSLAGWDLLETDV